MEITVNGTAVVDATAKGAATLQDVLNNIYAKTEASRLVITQIVLNGQVLDGAEEARLSGMSAANIRELRIAASPYPTFLAEQGAALLDQLERLEVAGRQAAARFRDGRIREAAEQFRSVVEYTKRMIEAIGDFNGLLLYGNYLARLERAIEREPVDPRIEACCDALGRATTALADRVPERFGAALSEQWLPLIATWKGELRQRLAPA